MSDVCLEILRSKTQFAQRNPNKVPRVMLNPVLFRTLLRVKDDDTGVHVAWLASNISSWCLLGMAAVVDDEVEHYEIF